MTPRPSRSTGLALVLVAVVVGAVLAGVASSNRDGHGRAPVVHPAVPVTALDQATAPANNSPLLVADPAQPQFVVLASRVDAPDFGCALHVSGDGGRGWLPVDPVPVLPAGAEKCYAPEVAFDRRGRLHLLFVGLHGAGNEPMGAFLVSSDDRGQTFTTPRRVLGPSNFAVRMAVDRSTGARGRIHLIWLHATSDPPLGGFGPPPNPILASHSDDGGATFSEPVQVNDPHRERVVAPALALGPGGDVHVAYYDLGDDAVDYQGLEGPTWEGTWSVVVASSRDAGRTFAKGTVVDSAVVPGERVMLVFTMPAPSIAAGDRRRVCVAWTDARHGDADAMLRCSRDGANTWSPVRRLNDDPIGNGSRQYLPRLSLSGSGRLDAVFYDRRDDRENTLNRVYYTYSVDGGLRFAKNTPVTAEGFNSRIGAQYANVSAQGQVEFGSRIALHSEDDHAVAAWTDTGNSKRLVGNTGQDVFATRIDVPSRRSALAPKVAGAAGALLVAGAALAFVVRAPTRRRRGAGATATFPGPTVPRSGES